MKLKFIFVFLLLLSSCTSSDGPMNLENIVDKKASALLEDKRFHSVSIAVYNDGQAFSKHFGELTKSEGNKPTNGSIYEVGSITKLFTGMLAAKAVVEGKISLDDDVRKYLDRAYANLEYNHVPVSIKHLLTHTSNFPNFPIKGENKNAFFDGLNEVKMHSEPGTQYAYSNMAAELMAYILEKAYQQPYEQLLIEYISTIPGASNTKLDLNDLEKSLQVKGYNEQGTLMPNFDRNLWGGMVGLHSTSSDLLALIKHQLNVADTVMNESHRKLFEISSDLSIAYHWYINEKSGVISYRHHGGIYGMQNWLVIYPQHNIGISVISNASFEGVGDSLEEIVEDVFKEIKYN